MTIDSLHIGHSSVFGDVAASLDVIDSDDSTEFTDTGESTRPGIVTGTIVDLNDLVCATAGFVDTTDLETSEAGVEVDTFFKASEFVVGTTCFFFAWPRTRCGLAIVSF